MARRDNHLAARALADWARHGFTRATERNIADTYKVSTRTLWRWKDALDSDTELSALFRDRLNDLLDRDWSEHLNDTLAASINRMRDLIDASDDLPAVTEAFRALSEVAITREVLRGATDAPEDRGYAPAGGARANGSQALN